MKLDTKRTIFVGFAFFLICAFWQAYDNTIPLILIHKFGMNQTWSGLVMALDNILAVFLLPIFGILSDRCHSRFGRRTPFIVVGTVAAVAALLGIATVDAGQAKLLSSVSDLGSTQTLTEIYNTAGNLPLMTSEGERYVLAEKYTRESFTALAEPGHEAENACYAEPARRAYAAKQTSQEPYRLVLFIVLLLTALLSMAIFRSPAVALMPDVTPKPLRSRANAVINLMGSIGGILVLLFGLLFGTATLNQKLASFFPYLATVAALMLLSLLIFLLNVREPTLVKMAEQEAQSIGLTKEIEDKNKRKLSKDKLHSLIFLLLSIVLWFMGYNAVTSKYSVYATSILRKNYNLTLMIAQAAAILSYLPVGFISARFGRKKTILVGVVMLTFSFLSVAFMTAETSDVFIHFGFILAGIAWATINVNSFPMVVEMCSGSDIGKYTGIYYTASMTAQIVTPILSGALMDALGMRILLPYATVFSTLAFFTMLRVRHGDTKPIAPRGLEAFGEQDD